MSSQWLYSRDGNDHGPVSSSELMELAKNGQLLPTDLLWKEGMAEWKPASSFPKLFPPQASADEMPVFVVTDNKPKTAHQSGDGTAKKRVLQTTALSKKQPALDPFLVGLAIFFVAPWGLYLLWRHPVLKHRTKWWVSACGWLLFLVVVGAFDDSEMQSDADADARMQTDARECAELQQEFLKAASQQMAELSLSMINKTPYKNSHKEQVDAVAEKIEGIKKRYSSGENKTKFEALIKKAEADLPQDSSGQGASHTSPSNTSRSTPSDHALSVLRQCTIGSTPEFVASLMREKGLERTATQNKTQDGKPRLIHFYGPDDAVFFFGRNSASGAWGLGLVRIDRQGYFPPMTSGGPPIRMNK